MTRPGQERLRPSPVSDKATLSLLLETFYFRKGKKKKANLAIVFPLIGHTLNGYTAYTHMKIDWSQPRKSWVSAS